MTYWLEGDTFHDDPRWSVLAGGTRPAAIDRLQAAHARMMSMTSHHRHDGYLTADQVMAACRRRDVVDALCRPVLGLPPMLHRQGDDCPCLGGAWIDGFGFRIHQFLKRNPSRAENDRSKAHKAELNDARLKAIAYDRDGGCCRYCRSGPVSEKAVRARDRRRVRNFDHVDPDKLAGDNGENFVTACEACNKHKGKRTPDEAEMLLLPVPSLDQAAEWLARDEPMLFDRPPYVHPARRRITAENSGPITAGSPPDHRSIGDPIGDRPGDGDGDRIGDPNDGHTGELRPEQGEHRSGPPASWSENYPGRVGEPPTSVIRAGPAVDELGQQARAPNYPDIYTRRSRSPTAGDNA